MNNPVLKIMRDPYMLRYITEYLKLCTKCNSYDIYNL